MLCAVDRLDLLRLDVVAQAYVVQEHHHVAQLLDKVPAHLRIGDDPVITLNGKAIGRVKGWDVSPYNGYLQLGYDIAPAYHGKGYMTEAVGGVIRYMLLQAEANRVYCSVRECNAASRRVCEKNGMRHEGVLRQHYARQDGGYDDVHIYGIIRDDLRKGSGYHGA